MVDSPADPLAEAVAPIVRHMNEDHAGDSLLICRHLGRHPHAEAAELVSVDVEGATFAASVAGTTVAIRIPWTRRIAERGEVRTEMVAMLDHALVAGGLPPHEATEH